MQTVQRKHFQHVIFSSGRRLVRSSKSRQQTARPLAVASPPVGTAGSFTLLPRGNLGKKTCLRAACLHRGPLKVPGPLP